MTFRPAALEAARKILATHYDVWHKAVNHDGKNVGEADAIQLAHVAAIIEQALSATSEPVKDARTMQERLESVGYTFTPLASPSAGGEAAQAADAAADEISRMLQFSLHGMDIQLVGPKREQLLSGMSAIIQRHLGRGK